MEILLLLLMPLFVLPLIVGIHLMRTSSPHTPVQMIAIFTLKPILATPILFSLIAIFGQSLPRSQLPLFVFCALPGVILTCAILFVYRAALRSAGAGPLLFILLCDGLRWGSTALGFAFAQGRPTSDLAGIGLLGVAMPSLFALVALALAKAVRWDYSEPPTEVNWPDDRR